MIVSAVNVFRPGGPPWTAAEARRLARALNRARYVLRDTGAVVIETTQSGCVVSGVLKSLELPGRAEMIDLAGEEYKDLFGPKYTSTHIRRDHGDWSLEELSELRRLFECRAEIHPTDPTIAVLNRLVWPMAACRALIKVGLGVADPITEAVRRLFLPELHTQLFPPFPLQPEA